MKKILLYILIIILADLSLNAQISPEFSLGYSNSIFLKNKFAGTSETYENQEQYSSVNLKCSNLASIMVTFEHAILKSNWFASYAYQSN